MDKLISKDNVLINFSGITHDHAFANLAIDQRNSNNNNRNHNNDDAENIEIGDTSCSAIVILRRHPMYDCLVLVKKFRTCLDGYALEFPIDKLTESEMETFESEDQHQIELQQDHHQQQEASLSSSDSTSRCRNRRLVSRFLDGDDFMSWTRSNSSPNGGSQDTLAADYLAQSAEVGSPSPVINPFEPQLDDKGEPCELVHVPINGLLDRLEGYTRSGVAVDSRVYAFAMGLKTSERILTTNSMKELQETPI